MRVSVDFGCKTMELEVPDERLVALQGKPAGEAIADVAGAVSQVLESPLQFPPLRRAVVPGDHVAIVLDEGVPHMADVLGPIVEHLVAAGVQAYDIQIVEVPRDGGARDGLTPDTVPPGVKLVRHDPANRSRLSYLASTRAGTRVYLNREIVDADLVVLVGRVDYHPLMGFRGTGSSVFPGLADEAAAQQFRAGINKSISRQTRAAARRETDEVAWLLGVQFAVQLVLGPHAGVLAVLAGQCAAVQQQGQQIVGAVWRRRAGRRAELVVAGLSGHPDQHGFQQLGAGVAAASGLAEDGGRIVVLSSINATPGPTLRCARELEEPAQVMDYLKRHPGTDAISTWQIARANQHARVYLMSQLDGAMVEELFMTPIAGCGEVQRLIDQARSCIILHDAQLTHVAVEGENEEPIL